MRHQLDLEGRLLRRATKDLTASAVPEDVCGTQVLCATLPGTDRAVLTDAAESVKSKGGVALIVGVTDTLAVIMASGTPAVDCRKLLPEVLKQFGGRGGGKPDFAQGGVTDPTQADEVLKAMRSAVEKSLSSSS